jgi:hypothetical protein
MNKMIGIVVLAMTLMVASAMAVTPMWTVDKSTTVTGDWAWNGEQWTLPSPTPVTATYGFQAYGNGDLNYQEVEILGQAWEYNFENQLTSTGTGAIHSFADITTVNPPATTPGTAWTQYRFTNANFGAFTSTPLVIQGYADVHTSLDKIANFGSAFMSHNTLCINDCSVD